jgi:regulatory protein
MPKKSLDIASLSKEEQLKLALEKAMRYVTARELSSIKLSDKLTRYGFSDEVVNATLIKSIEYGFIDDVRYCECLIRSAVAQGHGLNNVLREIKELDIDPNTLDAYLEYMDSGDTRQYDDAMEYLLSHPVRSKNQKQAAFRKLVSKGFSFDVASKVANQWFYDCVTNQDC